MARRSMGSLHAPLVWAALSCCVLPAAGSSMLPTLSKTAKSQGDSRMAAVATCGADLSATAAALGSAKKAVSVLKGSTTLAVLDAHSSVPDGALAVAASQVVVLEVRLADLIEQGPNGLAQLQPLLQRSLRLCPNGPKKLLLLAVVDHEPSEVSESAISDVAAAQLDALWAALALPDGCEASAWSDALELQCAFLPHPMAPDFDVAVEELKARFLAAEGSGYLFSDGRYTALASALGESVDSLAALPAPPPVVPASPAELHAAYAAGLAAEAATKEFQKGLSALKKAAEASLVPDFGEQAAKLLSDALERFDAAAPAPSASCAASRRAMEAQLQRALLLPFRKQVSTLVKQSLAKLRQKLAAMRPSAEVETELLALRKELRAAFEAQAAQLRPAGLGFSEAYERRELYDALEQACTAHVENLRVQGLYLPTKRTVFPVDFSAHWLMLNPFGKDARYDTVGAGDKPAFRPSASPMRLRAANGYKPERKLQDPKRMVFTDKMMS